MSGNISSGNVTRLADLRGQSSSFTSGGGGPYDPTMEARVALLERGFDEMRAAMARIESAQAELAKELRDFRRDMKETELPAIRSSIASIDASLKEKPSSKDFLSLAQNLNGTLYRVVGLCLTMMIAGAGVWSWLRSQGYL